jgi:hypothetical protein
VFDGSHVALTHDDGTLRVYRRHSRGTTDAPSVRKGFQLLDVSAVRDTPGTRLRDKRLEILSARLQRLN